MTVRYDVVLSELAIEDIIAIGQWIATEADRRTADEYIGRINAFFLKLSDFPRRGTPRDDLVSGLRTMPFERRVVIGYRVEANEVFVLRVVSGAQDMSRLFERK